MHAATILDPKHIWRGMQMMPKLYLFKMVFVLVVVFRHNICASVSYSAIDSWIVLTSFKPKALSVYLMMVFYSVQIQL